MIKSLKIKFTQGTIPPRCFRILMEISFPWFWALSQQKTEYFNWLWFILLLWNNWKIFKFEKIILFLFFILVIVKRDHLQNRNHQLNQRNQKSSKSSIEFCLYPIRKVLKFMIIISYQLSCNFYVSNKENFILKLSKFSLIKLWKELIVK